MHSPPQSSLLTPTTNPNPTMAPPPPTTIGPPSRHVAVCPFPLASHPATLLLLTTKLAASAPTIHFSFFVASPTSVGPIDSANVGIRVLSDGVSDEEKAALHPGERMRVFVEGVGENLRESMRKAEEEVGMMIGFVVADALMSPVCGEIATEKRVQWAALWTSGDSSLAAHMFTDLLRDEFGNKEFEAYKEETVDKYISGFPPIPISDLPHDVINNDVVSPGGKLLHLMSLSLPNAAAVAVNSFRSLEPSIFDTLNSLFRNNLLHLGPFQLTLGSNNPEPDPYDCLPWLDSRLEDSGPASVAYISFGTALTPSVEELLALNKALESTRIPFLWSLPEQGISKLGRVGSQGKVVSWAPQRRVLSHPAVGAHVTHCGWNSVVESIVSGVPMVCRPFDFAEQMLNKRLVESVWRIGVAVEGGRLTETGAAEVVVKVVVGEEGKKMRERIKEIQRLAQEDAAQDSAMDFEKLVKIVSS